MYNVIYLPVVIMDFETSKEKALSTFLPLNTRRAFIVLCIEASWSEICVESVLIHFGKKYNLWGMDLTNLQIGEMIEELEIHRQKTVLINKQYQLFNDWKSKRGLDLGIVKGIPVKDIFNNRVKAIWNNMVA